MVHGDPDILWSSDRTLRIGAWEDSAAMAAALARFRAVPGVLDVVGGHEFITLRLEAGADAGLESVIRAAVLPSPSRREGQGDGALDAGLSAGARASGALPAPAPQPLPSGRGSSPIAIPVSFAAADAPDLAAIAARASLSIERLIERICAADLTVRFLGFAPGFAYITGLPVELHSPRLPSPRTRVPAGSVAIGGEYLGIYPRESAGGWNIIGRAALPLFDAARGDSLLHAGDRVRLVPVDPGEGMNAKDAEIAKRSGGEPAASVTVGAGDEEQNFPPVCPPLPVFSAPSRPSRSDPLTLDALSILDAGSFLTAPQTLGTPGRGHAGVPWGGAADELSLRIGNRLLGNPDEAPALELTHIGGRRAALIRFDAPAAVALTGAAELEVRAIDAGGTLTIPPPAPGRGCRVYMGAGGANTAPRPPSPALRASLASLLSRRVLRVTPGPHAGAFTDSQRACFFSTVFLVTPDSDRAGMRLSPALPMDAAMGGEMRSEAMIHGMIQVTPDGTPIALGPDAPVTGGYPVIASVIGADLPALGQARPGERVRFIEVPLDEAWAEARARRAWLDAVLPSA